MQAAAGAAPPPFASPATASSSFASEPSGHDTTGVDASFGGYQYGLGDGSDSEPEGVQATPQHAPPRHSGWESSFEGDGSLEWDASDGDDDEGDDASEADEEELLAALASTAAKR